MAGAGRAPQSSSAHRLITAPHVHAIQTRPPSRPLSSSPASISVTPGLVDSTFKASHAVAPRRAPRRALPRGARRARARVLHPRRVERRPPASVVVLRQLEVEAVPVHPDDDVADAGPGVEPGAERVQCAIVREHRATREAERRCEEKTPLARSHYRDHNPRHGISKHVPSYDLPRAEWRGLVTRLHHVYCHAPVPCA